jgi:ADP-ribose pyrophosphatase YjhB (NUDIX family)
LHDAFQNPAHIPVWNNVWDGNTADLQDLLSPYSGTLDAPACLYWQELASAVPEVPVLLTVRDPDDWWESVRETIYPIHIDSDKLQDSTVSMNRRTFFDGYLEGKFEDREFATSMYQKYCVDVRSSVPADRLLEYQGHPGMGASVRTTGLPGPDKLIPKPKLAKGLHTTRIRKELTVIYPSIVQPRLRYRYCPMCRAELTHGKDRDGLGRVLCPDCSWIHYPTNATGVNIVITTEDGIVALLPPDADPAEPAALPSGHLEYGESTTEGAIRESREETGLVVEIVRILGWDYTRNEAYPGPMIHFFYETRAVGGTLQAGEEGRVEVYAIDDFPAISKNRGGSLKAWQSYRELVGRSN